MHKLLDKLSRVTPNNRYIKEIDGLRFFAIITVVILHTATNLLRLHPDEFSSAATEVWFKWFCSRNGLGVDVFFAISGFILALPFIGFHRQGLQQVSLKKYFLRRLTRLEPPYVISLVLLFGIQVAISRLAFWDSLPNFFASLFYIHNIVFDKWSVINPVAWSLEIEVQFYLMAPIIFYLLFTIRNNTARRLIQFFLILIFIALNFVFHDQIEDAHLRKSIIVEMHLFLIGILFADFYLLSDLANIKKSFLYDVLGLMAIVALYILRDQFAYVIDVIYSFSILILFLTAFKGKIINYLLTRKVVTVLGGMCYSLYLLHYAILAVVMSITKTLFFTDSFILNMIIQVISIWPVILIAASLFFYWIEKPCMEPGWFLRFKRIVFKPKAL